MKSHATEYFTSLSPVKSDIKSLTFNMNKKPKLNGKAGRCHCCPYGYHIDLDFVRFCQVLNQGAKNDNPTLVKLKKLRKERRRQAKSIEALLGVPGSRPEDESAWFKEANFTSLSSSSESTSLYKKPVYPIPSSIPTPPPRERKKLFTPPSPPPRKQSLIHPGLKSPPPDIINSSKLFPSRRNEQASEALQEAVLNFEETLESSRDPPNKKRYDVVPTIDLHHHSPSFSSRFNQKNSVGRSNSLPRQFLYDSGPQYPTKQQYFNHRDWNGTVSSGNTMNGYSHTYNQSPTLMTDAMAALDAARGFSSDQPQDIDTISIASGMSGVSTSTLQSIRDQMATGLSRLKDLEDEVRNIPKLKLRYNILKEEKRILIEQMQCLHRGEVPPLSPPTLDIEELTDEDLSDKLLSLKKYGKASRVRNRSVSPMRVNLEDFHSYRRARRGSVSEGSDTESVHSYRTRDKSRDCDETRLHISESGDSDWRFGRKNNNNSSLPSTPLAYRKTTTRDVSVSCKVVTRDVGVSHVSPRSRSVATSTVMEREKPCVECQRRSRKVYVSKGIGTVPYKRDTGRLSLSSISSESIDPEDQDPKVYEHGTSKNALLEKLGKKSPIVSRLSSSQLYPPVLTFDNSTNTEPVRHRDQRSNTSLRIGDLFTREELVESIREAKKQWEATNKSRSTSPFKERTKRSLTFDKGCQTHIEVFKIKTQSVGVMARQSTRDTGVGYSSVFEEKKVSSVRTRSVACSTDPLPDTSPKRKSVGVGDCRISDTVCEECAIGQSGKRQMRSLGCSFDRITDVVCDKCSIQKHHVGVGNCRITDDICKKCKMKRVSNVSCQAKPIVRSVSVEVDLLPVLKEVSIATTPEVERRAFGSSGIRVCDKCHEAITSVAKDMVLTGGSPTSVVVPNQSKIPRLVDHQKAEIQSIPPASETHDRNLKIDLSQSSPLKKEKSFVKNTDTASTTSHFSLTLDKPKSSEKDLFEPLQKEDNTSTTSAVVASSLPSFENTVHVDKVPYNRQDTYTKSPTNDRGLVHLDTKSPTNDKGLVNLGFREIDPKAKDQSPTRKVTRMSPEKSLISPIKESNEAVSIIDGKKEESSSSSSDQEDQRDEVSSIAASSIATVDTQATDSSKLKAQPSREMKAALKVLNDSIGKSFRSGQQLNNAINIIQREWLKISSQKDADPHAVEDYMDSFEKFSKGLLGRVVNLSDINGNTAMHYAVSHGNFDVVSVLLDSKVCNINQQNKAGYTAIMLVALAPIKNAAHASVVKKLFEVGDINIKASQHGQTGLMLAVSHGRLDMVKMLVYSGADPNIQDEDGSTALMCAAEHGHLAIVRYLVAQPDTDLYLMDNDGSTALTIAVEAGHKDVGVLLYKQMNLSRGSSPYSSMRGGKRPRTPTMARASMTPPPRSSAPTSPGRSRKSSGRVSPVPAKMSSASLSNLNF